MTTYSLQQLLTLAQQAGFTGQNADIAAAIAEAESGGNVAAYNPETGAGAAPGWGSYGLWQIFRTAHPQYSPTQLDTPAYNAQAAYQVYQAAGDSFSPWSTYHSGAYQQYLSQLTGSSGAPLPPASGGSSGGGVTGTPLAGSVLSPTDWVSAIQTGFTDAFQRVGLITFGALIVLVGVVVLFFSEEASEGSQGSRNAAAAAPVVEAAAA